MVWKWDDRVEPPKVGTYVLNRANARLPVFVYQGRFKSFPIQEDEHLYAVARYVERNALRAKLVRRAERWRWGRLYRWLRNSAEIGRASCRERV